MLGPEVDQRHVVAMQRKMSAHIAADCAAAEHYDTLTHYFLPPWFVTSVVCVTIPLRGYSSHTIGSGKKMSDDLGTLAILGFANLIGLEKH